MAKKIPLRKCTGCGEMKDKRDMIRIVRSSEKEFFIDATGKMNGRGAYICKSSSCLEASIKNRGLERSFKTSIPKEISENLKEALDALE